MPSNDMCGGRNHTNVLIALCVVFWFISGKGNLCSCNEGVDTLSVGQSLSGSHTLISKEGIFELGFFSPDGSSSSTSIYLGIWHKYFPDKTVVWVANRDAPLSNKNNSRLELSPNGNLALFRDSGDFIWNTNLMSKLPDTIEAVLLDSGNLILRDGLRPKTIFWQSFDHPTDKWLPGAVLGFNKLTGRSVRLVSWGNVRDPSPGLFSLEISRNQSEGLFLQWNSSIRYWMSGAWSGVAFRFAPEISFLMSFTYNSNENGTYVSYTSLRNDSFVMLTLNASGSFEQLASRREDLNQEPIVALPKNQAEIFALCGPFGIFRYDPLNPCTCVPGFVLISDSDRPKNWSGHGCRRESLLQCESGSLPQVKEYGFLEVSITKVPANPEAHPRQSETGCESVCLKNCACTAYAFSDGKCSIWNGALLNLQNISASDGRIQHFYLKLKVANSELQGRKKIVEAIVAFVVPLVVVVLGAFLGFLYYRKTKHKENKEDLLSFDFNYGIAPTNDGIMPRKRNNTEFDLPIFSYKSVLASTNNFSSENKLGEGGFGPVYLGKLCNGEEIALKRLSKKSRQGSEEFMNEILLIAKLQHINLVRMLGCCIDPDESILIYEYMPNKSLDFFLFDSKKRELLDWATRVRIIEGIAQGLLYLHEYSRLHVIHRDLKASNILLDGEMNPKISDFGMARIFVGNTSETYTNRIVGTYGYVAPEYMLHGLFSVKSDVFSFGVLVLEIVSGKKNTSFYSADFINLLGQVWELWKSNKGHEVIDPSMAMGRPDVSTALRYINIGLVCVQENPNDRPNMSRVVSMLSSEVGDIAAPKQPPSFRGKGMPTTNFISSRNGSEESSLNGLTTSKIEPR